MVYKQVYISIGEFEQRKRDKILYEGYVIGLGYAHVINDSFVGKEATNEKSWLYNRMQGSFYVNLIFVQEIEVTEDTVMNSFPEVPEQEKYSLLGVDNADLKTMVYALGNPANALSIGSSKKGSDNVTTRVSRFIERDVVYVINSSKDRVEDDVGKATFGNALRHTLWQAHLANSYSVDEALKVGNAHEINPDIDLSQRRFNSLEDADQTVDLLNNIIGRQIGNTAKKPMNELAIDVLEVLRSDGLYIANKADNGS